MRKLILAFLLLLTVMISAQDGPDTGVWITTQDRSSFRAGPGTHWERLDVIPPAVTLPAIGRTADARWVQIVYEHRVGWVAAWLVVWSGNLIELPVDNMPTETFVRRANIKAITTRDAPIYREEVDPSTQVGVLPAKTDIELTGRLGGGSNWNGYFQYQLMWDGQLYWISSFNVRILDGGGRLLDNTYRYAYGRLVRQLDDDIENGRRRLRSIESLWLELRTGGTVRCDVLPDTLTPRRAPDSDVSREPIFGPLVMALDSAYGRTNTAITSLADACNRDELFLTEQDVIDALADINEARRNYNIARSLLESLSRRDPNISN